MKSILDKSFRYTSSVETDLRKTFARIRKEQKEQATSAAAEAAALKARAFKLRTERAPSPTVTRIGSARRRTK